MIYGNHEFRVPKKQEETKSNDILVVHHYSKLQWDEWLKKNKESMSFSHGGFINPSDPIPYAKSENKIFILDNK